MYWLHIGAPTNLSRYHKLMQAQDLSDRKSVSMMSNDGAAIQGQQIKMPHLHRLGGRSSDQTTRFGELVCKPIARRGQ
jgi:hypothetical protein